ncbi:MAG: D-glycerate dehydrogenase [Candidatus Rokubacteria bacterium]|nr:D-glycerate dehydrogenase [Candidatus Rokubacteria bacterium]
MPERFLVAEDDPPLRLVGLALGAPLDARMRGALARFFLGDPEASLVRLRAIADEVGVAGDVVPALATGDPLETQLAGVHYLLVEGAEVTDAVLARGADLRFVQKHGEDARNIDVAAAVRRGIPVARLRRAANSSVAEQTMLLLLAVARRLLPAHAAAVRPTGDVARGESSYNWPRLDGMRSVRGMTIGLVGLGEIGREVARRAAAFDMRVLYTQRRRLETALERTLHAEFRPLASLLAESDVVSLHVPLGPDTRTMLGAAELERMRPGAILVNTSRGGLVDEAALIAALRSGHLGGAGLDVRAEEPPRDAAGLAELPTVVLTPHVAAGVGADLMADVRTVLENVVRVRRGERLESYV